MELVNVGARLKYFRKKKGFTQQAIATELGITQQAYARYESDSFSLPPLHFLYKIADILEYNPDIFVLCLIANEQQTPELHLEIRSHLFELDDKQLKLVFDFVNMIIDLKHKNAVISPDNESKTD